MEVKASVKYLRTAPRKVRLVCELIKNKRLKEAQNQLLYLKKQAAKDLLSLLKSAEANAKQKDLDIDKLYIKNIRCDEGPAFKRLLIMSRGRATTIKKKMSHVTVILSDKVEK